MLNLDFSNVKDRQKPLPPGDYVFTITNAEVNPPKEGKTGDNLLLSLDVTSADDPENIGRDTKHNINIQESTMWRVKEFFVAITGDEELTNVELNDASELVGSSFGATVDLTDDGKYNDFVAYYHAS